MFKLSKRSLNKLKDVHPELVAVVKLAIEKTTVDFSVLEGVRSFKRQKELVAAGASKTMRSYHLTGHAVDLGAYVSGEIRWDWPLYYELDLAMSEAASELKIGLVWGGGWKSFPDGPHFQLTHKDKF